MIILHINLKNLEKIKVYLMLGFVCSFLINSFIFHKILEILMVFLIIVIIIFTLPLVRGFNKYLSVSLFIIGIYLLSNNKANLQDWMKALIENAGLISLLLTVPLLGITLYYDDFQTNIARISEKHMKSNFSFYVITILMINILGMLLNLASLPLVHQIMERLSEKYSKESFYKALTRGFSTNILWSPNFVSVAVVLHYLKIPWYKIAPAGFSLALLATLLSIFIEKLNTVNKQKIKHEKTKSINENNGLIILKLTFLIFFLIAFIIALENYTHKSVLIIVPLVSFIAPLVLAIILKKTNIYKIKFKEYLNYSLPRMNNEVLLFTSIGFLGYALSISGLNRYIPLIIEKLGFNTPATLIPLFLVVISVLSIAGVHPIITISTIAVTLSDNTIPLSEIQMALTLLAGYLMYTIISPFSAVTLIVSSISKQNPLNVSLKLNCVYAVLFGILATLLLIFIG